MYRTSSDRRFRKNKAAIQRAYIDLVIEKGYQHVTITDIADRADINRMTFYAHYETIEDIFSEFVDDMEHTIRNAVSKEREFDLDQFFMIMNELMFKEEAFFRYAAKEGNCSDFREAFRIAIWNILDIRSGNSDKVIGMIGSDLVATCIAYSYLDWLSGKYGDVELSAVIGITRSFLHDHIGSVDYKR